MNNIADSCRNRIFYKNDGLPFRENPEGKSLMAHSMTARIQKAPEKRFPMSFYVSQRRHLPKKERNKQRYT